MAQGELLRKFVGVRKFGTEKVTSIEKKYLSIKDKVLKAPFLPLQ